MIVVCYAVEGWTDEPVAEKIISSVGFVPHHTLTADGKANLDKKLPGLNKSAASMPWLVIRDLDDDDEQFCIPDLRANLLGRHEHRPSMCLRFAVRSMESWLMADRDEFASFFGIRRGLLEEEPETLINPRQYLTSICARSRKRQIKQGIPPRPGQRRSVGPEYNDLVREFAEDHWDPQRACANAPSLKRALDCLTMLRDSLPSAG